MLKLKVRRSSVDERYVEVICTQEVVDELWAPFPLKGEMPECEAIEDVLSWLKGVERKGVRALAYRLVAVRSYARSALMKKLEAKGFSSGVCEEVVGELERLGYLNDQDYRTGAIEKEWRKGFGPRYIEMKLRSLGLDARGVRTVIDEKRQIEAIEKLMRKLQAKQPSQKFKYLLRRGFDVEVIRKYF